MVSHRALTDLLTLLLTWALLLWLRSSLSSLWFLEPVAPQNSAWMGGVLIPTWMVALAASGAWSRPQPWRMPPWITAAPIGLVVSLALFELARIEPVTRSLAVGFALVTPLALGLVRAPQRRKPHRVLLVGTDRDAAPWQAVVDAHPTWRIEVERAPADPQKIHNRLTGPDLDEVYVAGHPSHTTLQQIASACEARDLPLSLDASFLGHRTNHAALVHYDGWPLITFRSTPPSSAAIAFKRGVDLIGAGVGLALVAPLIGALALWIRWHDGGAAFFVQRRMGLHGRPFPMLKLRTMVPDAEERLDALWPHNEVIGPAFRMKNDPRLTGPGRWLRALALDELPQLWNVLRGEMSLVGPRPPTPREVASYAPWQLRRLSVPPGITGLWQVSGHHLTRFEDWVALDLAYVDRWTPWLDLVLLLRTPMAVLRNHKAS